MNIRIEPFTVNPGKTADGIVPAEPGVLMRVPEGADNGAQTGAITYWGVYLDNSYITHSSTRELAEKTKDWMEKWLKGEN